MSSNDDFLRRQADDARQQRGAYDYRTAEAERARTEQQNRAAREADQQAIAEAEAVRRESAARERQQRESEQHAAKQRKARKPEAEIATPARGQQPRAFNWKLAGLVLIATFVALATQRIEPAVSAAIAIVSAIVAGRFARAVIGFAAVAACLYFFVIFSNSPQTLGPREAGNRGSDQVTAATPLKTEAKPSSAISAAVLPPPKPDAPRKIYNDRFDPARPARPQFIEYASSMGIVSKNISRAMWTGKFTPHQDDLAKVERELFEAKAEEIGMKRCKGPNYIGGSLYCWHDENCAVLRKQGYDVDQPDAKGYLACPKAMGQFSWDMWRSAFGTMPEWVSVVVGSSYECQDGRPDEKTEYCKLRMRLLERLDGYAAMSPSDLRGAVELPDPLPFTGRDKELLDEQYGYFSGASAFAANVERSTDSVTKRLRGTGLLYRMIRQSIFLPYAAKSSGAVLP